MSKFSNLLFVESYGCDSFIADDLDSAIEYIENLYGYTDLDINKTKGGFEITYRRGENYDHVFQAKLAEKI